MAKVNVGKWFGYEDSTKLEQQVKYFIASETECFLNSYYDGCSTEPKTKQEWQDLIYRTIGYYDKMIVNGKEYNHLKFYGKDKILKLIDTYLDNYEDIQDYIKR